MNYFRLKMYIFTHVARLAQGGFAEQRRSYRRAAEGEASEGEGDIREDQADRRVGEYQAGAAGKGRSRGRAAQRRDLGEIACERSQNKK